MDLWPQHACTIVDNTIVSILSNDNNHTDDDSDTLCLLTDGSDTCCMLIEVATQYLQSTPMIDVLGSQITTVRCVIKNFNISSI